MGNFWTFGFWVFAALCATVTWWMHRLRHRRPIHPGPPPATTEVSLEPIALRRRMSWIALPALASLAFIATTDHVSHNVAPEPRLWIAALGLYLLTFIVSFDHPRWYRRAWVAAAAHIANAYLKLYPVVKRQAEHLNIGFRNKYQPRQPERRIRYHQYFVMTNDAEYLRRYPSVNRQYFDPNGKLIGIQDPNLPDVPLWTDHFSSLNRIEIDD